MDLKFILLSEVVKGYIWHSGNSKTIMLVDVGDFKTLGFRREGWIDEAQEIILGQWHYSVWYYNINYMLLCISQPIKLYSRKNET